MNGEGGAPFATSGAAIAPDRTDAAVELGVSCSRFRVPHSALRSRTVLRHSGWDALFVGLALLHGVLLVLMPSVPLIALGLWWNANTISHNFIHRPFFQARWLNVGFAAYLSALLGFPQSLWAARHLAHHRHEEFHWRPVRPAWLAQGALVLALWTALIGLGPGFFLTVYLPGWLLGLGLCQLQGHYEHVRGAVSHYGWVYNRLFFNDGYHVEHHARPARHWKALPLSREATEMCVSRWPAILRWLETASLDGLEEWVCGSARLQRFVLRVHERALARLLATMPRPSRVVIVGGGLFPRTALAFRHLLPNAELTILDMRGDRIDGARTWLDERVEFIRGFGTSTNIRTLAGDADLVVVPLALRGSRDEFYRNPPAPRVLVHDWLWRRRGRSVVVSWMLLKRLNLVGR
jgi:fatty acid desaturase